MNKFVDITPHPRILQVLGEIEFKPWQCLAELIDNSADQFINFHRNNETYPDPTIQVAVSPNTVVVKDNGEGLLIDTLQNAVKAGWTSNAQFGNLGLYGIGFNIATARMGNTTTIWTTTKGQKDWLGLEINLKKIAIQGDYKLTILSREKSNIQNSGTEVEITGIKPDWVDLFGNNIWIKKNITDKLANVYSTMLREENPLPVKFTLIMNGKKVQPWKHCVWPSDKTVFKKAEAFVSPIQHIDYSFGTKYLNRLTGEIFDKLPASSPAGSITEINERVYGWIGIQRYADENEYGIDILRNGRKIEIGNKEIFSWDDSDGNSKPEYPIDDPRARGRIVGEIHLDHGYVHYTKHRFEREHSSWHQLLKSIKNNEPLTKRTDRGFSGDNQSKLGTLFRSFRRNSPSPGQKWADILFIKDNEKAKDFADKYRKGISPYTDNTTWDKALQESDESEKIDGNTGESNSKPSERDAISAILGDGSNQPQPQLFPEKELEKITVKQPIPEFNMKVQGIGPSGTTYEFEVFAVEPFTGEKASAWKSIPTPRGIYEIELDRRHQIFNSGFDIHDAILHEAAYIITSEENQRNKGIGAPLSLSDVIFELRKRLGKNRNLDALGLRKDIEEYSRAIMGKLSRRWSDIEQQNALNSHFPQEKEKIELAHAKGPSEVPLFSYFSPKHAIVLLKKEPEKWISYICGEQKWTPNRIADRANVLKEYQQRLVAEILRPFEELSEFSDPLASTKYSRTQLTYLQQCLSRLKELVPGDS
jgi:hypothetical protein